MHIGVPKEIKVLETRVGLTPESVRVLTEAGHEVSVETHAGVGSSISCAACPTASIVIAPFRASTKIVPSPPVMILLVASWITLS